VAWLVFTVATPSRVEKSTPPGGVMDGGCLPPSHIPHVPPLLQYLHKEQLLAGFAGRTAVAGGDGRLGRWGGWSKEEKEE